MRDLHRLPVDEDVKIVRGESRNKMVGFIQGTYGTSTSDVDR
jgi:hypothetical protein